jgi:hypothetical protein
VIFVFSDYEFEISENLVNKLLLVELYEGSSEESIGLNLYIKKNKFFKGIIGSASINVDEFKDNKQRRIVDLSNENIVKGNLEIDIKWETHSSGDFVFFFFFFDIKNIK